MPEPRRQPSLRPVSLRARKATPAEEKKRARAGDTRGRGGKGLQRPVWAETRNGLPEFRPYVYRGTGVDQYEDDEEAEAS